MIRPITAAVLLLVSAAGDAQSGQAMLRARTPIALVTTVPLSSKTSAKGDMVPLRTSDEVHIDGRLVIPSGTPAMGQISDARAVGGLGVSGKLVIRPLYLRVSGRTVRLTGQAGDKGTIKADGVLGVTLIPSVSGRSAAIPAGTTIPAEVEKDVPLPPVGNSAEHAQQPK